MTTHFHATGERAPAHDDSVVSLLAHGMIDDPAVRQVKMPLRVREPSRVVRRQADGSAGGVELAEHLHQRFATL